MERSGELEEDGEEAFGGGFRDFCGEDAEAVVAAAEVAAGPVPVGGAEGGAGLGGLLAELIGTEFALDVLALGHGDLLWVKTKRPAFWAGLLLSISILENSGLITGKVFSRGGVCFACHPQKTKSTAKTLRTQRWNGLGFDGGIFQSYPSVAWMGHPLFPVLELGLSESVGDGL